MENIGLKLQNMCRTCKVETVSMISIDQEEICDNNLITPANMLMECTSVKVNVNLLIKSLIFSSFFTNLTCLTY